MTSSLMAWAWLAVLAVWVGLAVAALAGARGCPCGCHKTIQPCLVHCPRCDD